MNAINKIIMFNNDPNAIFEEEISILVAKAAVEIAKMRKNIIDVPPTPERNTIWEWLERKIKNLKEYFLGQGVELYDDTSTLGLKDSALCLNFLYMNYDKVINSNYPLSDQR